MTVKTRAALNTDADTLLADNTTKDISAGDVRQRVKDLADSQANYADSATKAALEAATVPAAINAIMLHGYTAAGDGGGGLYQRAGAEPTHAGKIQSADLAWWELVETLPDVRMFGSGVPAFQAAVDYLPTEGGTITVSEENYSALDLTTLTIPEAKAVTWLLRQGPTMPAIVPELTHTRGESDQPHEGGLGASSRPGFKFISLKARHQVKATQDNQQDSVLYIEGEGLPPGAGVGLTTEFAGIRVNMRMKDGTEAGAGIRGLHMTTTGDGGNAKLRSLRATSIGLDGHDGLVNGATITAVRTGVIPTSAGGNGTDVYASGDAGPYVDSDYALVLVVGPGIRGLLNFTGQAGAEKPQTAIQQGRGAQAILPEVAFIDMHGGGAGHLVRVLQDQTSSTVIALWKKTGKLEVPAIVSGTIALADDAATTIAAPHPSGMIEVWAENTLGGFVEGQYRTSTNHVINKVSGSLGAVMTATALTGTTGVDGNLTVSGSGGVIHLENRTGATRQVTYLFKSF